MSPGLGVAPDLFSASGLSQERYKYHDDRARDMQSKSKFVSTKQAREIMRQFTVTTSIVACWLSGLVSGSHPHDLHERQWGPEFDWSSIKPSSHLEWHECFEEYLCARLLVPLDWSRHNSSKCLQNDEKVALAVIKFPAAVPEHDPSFGGSILYNPGGPGSPGVGAFQNFGPFLQSVLDTDQKHFELISFDPRGVGDTTPSIGCYKSHWDRWAEEQSRRRLISAESSELALRYHLESYKSVWDLCVGASADSNIFAHSSTASVARDMLQIVDELAKSRNSSGQGVLNYFGQSYGTFLGTTFASMFPDRVGLMALDGVVAPGPYAEGTWIEASSSMEEVLESHWEYCFSLKDECPLWRATDSSGADIKDRLNELLADLDASPVGVATDRQTELLRSDNIRHMLVSLSYDNPRIPWVMDNLASLAYAISGDIEAYFGGFSEGPEWLCENSEAVTPAAYSGEDAQLTIRCIDAYGVNRNVTWAQRLLDSHIEQSPTVGASVAQWPLACIGFPEEFEPVYSYQGPWGAPAPESSENKTTVAPPLIINNRLDNVTPLSSAYGLSRLFEGSSVVVQEDVGHLATRIMGECLEDILQAYFQYGHLPENGTSCEAADIDFGEPPEDEWDTAGASILRKRDWALKSARAMRKRAGHSQPLLF